MQYHNDKSNFEKFPQSTWSKLPQANPSPLKIAWPTLAALWLAAWLLLGCNARQDLPETARPPEISTTVSPAIVSTGGDGAIGSAEPSATLTATPSTIAANSATPEPALTVDVCTDRAAFVEDVTIPDGAELHPGEPFTKTWRLQNSGNCPWTVDYGAVFVAGDKLGGSTDIPISEIVEPGANLDLSIRMQAPISTGSYRGSWMLRDPQGDSFGVGSAGGTAFWVQIEVVDHTSSALATPSSDSPAAGICPEATGSIVTMTINPDVPDPRCMIVQADQRLRVVNNHESSLDVALGHLTATVAAGESVTFELPFGELLMVGVHHLLVDPCCGGSIWLQANP